MIRPALNCPVTRRVGDPGELCAKCGSPMRLHAKVGHTLADAGFVRGDHPAWVALIESIPTPKEADALARHLPLIHTKSNEDFLLVQNCLDKLSNIATGDGFDE